MGLTDEEQELLAANFVSGQLGANSSLFTSGDQSEALYLLSQGFARLENDAGHNLATLGPGSVLGEVSSFRNSLQEVSATAVSDIEFWRLPDQKLRDIILQQPSIGIKLSKNFGSMIAQMQDYLVARLGQTVELSDMPPNSLRALAAQLRSQEVMAGQSLYTNGSPPAGLFLVETGGFELRPGVASGDSAQTVLPGKIIGVLALLTNKAYTEDAVANENSMVWALSADEFQALNTQHRGLRRSLARTVRARLSKSDQEKAAARMAEMPIFSKLPPETMSAVAKHMVLQHISAGERVYRIGESGESLYLIEEGEIELTAENASGVIEELARIGGGGYFGEMSLFSGQIRTEDATATRNTNLWVLFKSDLDELSTQHPAIGAALSQGLAARLAAEEMEDVGRFRSFDLLSQLSDEELGHVVGHLKPTRYRRGEQIFRISTPADSLYLLENGEVRVQTFNGGSWLLGPGDSIGEKAILTNQPHSGSVTAETDVDLWALSRADFDSLAISQPSVVVNLRSAVTQQGMLGEPQLAAGQPSVSQSIPGQLQAGQPFVEQQAPPPAVDYAASGAAVAAAAPNIPRPDAASAFQRPEAQPQTPVQTPLRPDAGRQVRSVRRGNNDFAAAEPASDAQYVANKYPPPQPSLGQSSAPDAPPVQAMVPPPANSGLARQRRAGVAANPLDMPEPRRRMGFREWYSGLGAFAKLWLAALILLLIYLIGIVVPTTLYSMFWSGVAAAERMIPISAASSLSAVYTRGSFEVMTFDKETAQELALADQQVEPTPTYTPFPTPTPVAVARAVNPVDSTNSVPRANQRAATSGGGVALPRFIKQVAQPAPVLAVAQPLVVVPTPKPTPTNTAEQAAYYAAIARGEDPNAPLVQAASVAVAREPEAAPAAPVARAWDPRLDQLGVRVDEASVSPGQEYWHLEEVIWWDEKESRGKHHAFVEVLDENGERIVGQPVKVKWDSGEYIGNTEDKAFPDYAFNYQMYAANRAYDITVEGLPSDKLVGAGLGDLASPFHRVHVSYLLTYQKRVK